VALSRGAPVQPCGIAAVRDVLWYSEAGMKPNTVVRFDPKTETSQSWLIPSGGGVVRNMDVTRDGNHARRAAELLMRWNGVRFADMVAVAELLDGIFR